MGGSGRLLAERDFDRRRLTLEYRAVLRGWSNGAAGAVLAVGRRPTASGRGSWSHVRGPATPNHAEVIYVPATLCAAVPDGVPGEQAAFATLGAVGLHGIHQAQLLQGERVVVAGLGLIGQLTVRLLAAYGHPVTGVDPSPAGRAEVERLGLPTCDLEEVEPGRADAVILTAATESNDLIARAPEWCRDRGRVVVVGDVGLDVPRRPFYDGEVEIRFSRSYGPGRYDPAYEEGGHDYPVGYVRWTEGRNLAEVLRLLAFGRVHVDDLITGRYPLDQAPAAYQRLEQGGVRALILTYPDQASRADGGGYTSGAAAPRTRTQVAPAAGGVPGRLTVSVCGAGLFFRQTLGPAFEATECIRWGVGRLRYGRQRRLRGPAPRLPARRRSSRGCRR